MAKSMCVVTWQCLFKQQTSCCCIECNTLAIFIAVVHLDHRVQMNCTFIERTEYFPALLECTSVSLQAFHCLCQPECTDDEVL